MNLNKKQKLRGENGAQDECDFLSARYFLHAIFPAFKVFEKISPQCCNQVLSDSRNTSGNLHILRSRYQ